MDNSRKKSKSIFFASLAVLFLGLIYVISTVNNQSSVDTRSLYLTSSDKKTSLQSAGNIQLRAPDAGIPGRIDGLNGSSVLLSNREDLVGLDVRGEKQKVPGEISGLNGMAID